MSCPARRNLGSGYVKPEDPELEVQNNCALAALMAAREQQDAALQSMWTGDTAPIPKAETALPQPVYTVPPSDTAFFVDGHFYKVPDAERAEVLHKSLATLAEERAKEEAKWAAYWTDASAATVAVKPAWENDTELTQTSRVSEPLVSEPLETKTESADAEDDAYPRIVVSELS
jgi:hypothetical protein